MRLPPHARDALWLQQVVKQMALNSVHVPSAENRADLGTKTLPHNTLAAMREMNGTVDPTLGKVTKVCAGAVRSARGPVVDVNLVRAAVLMLQALVAETTKEICRYEPGKIATRMEDWIDHMFVIKILFVWCLVLMTAVVCMMMCLKTKEVKKIVKIEVQVMQRTVATQAMCTYKRKYLQPRFAVLAEDLQGAWTNGMERP